MMIVAVVLMRAQGVHGTLDVHFFYTHAEALSWLTSLSPEMTKAYYLNELFDLLFISSYSFAAWVILQKKWAFLPGIMDLIETLSILCYLSFPSIDRVFFILCFITALKWMTGGVLVILIILKLNKKKS